MFWVCGYEGVLLVVLIEVMEIRLFSLYVVFGSKEGLFCEVLVYYFG